MRGHSFVALYRSHRHAEEARDRLRGLGVPDRDIELGDDEGRLFGEGVLPNDRFRYRAQLRDGRTAVCVRLRPEYDPDRLVEMIAETDPLDLEDDQPEAAAADRRHRVRSLVAEPLLAEGAPALDRAAAGGKPRARSRLVPQG
jgi:hypothetical protein